MTRVWFDERHGSLRLYMAGHANYDSRGGDIVCAAASALGFALLGFLESRDDGEMDIDWLAESGRLDVTAPRTAETETAFELVVTGLAQLERKYPNNISITIGSPHEG